MIIPNYLKGLVTLAPLFYNGAMSIDRQRIVGIIAVAFLFGLTAYLAAVIVEPPAGVLLVEDDGEPRRVSGWAADWPWRSAAAYPALLEVELDLAITDRRGDGARVALSLRAVLLSERLCRARGVFDALHPELPRLLAVTALRRLCAVSTLDDLYGPRRPVLAGLLAETLTPTLRRLGWRLDELRLVEVRPDRASRITREPVPVLLVNLGALDWKAVELLIDDGRLPELARLTARGARCRFARPGGDWSTVFSRELGFRKGLISLGYTGEASSTIYQPPPRRLPRLLERSPALRRQYQQLLDDLDAAGELLAAGSRAVWIGTGLYAEYARRFQPALQRYQSLRYGRRFLAASVGGETAEDVEYGLLFEELLIALDTRLAAVHRAVPKLAVILVAPNGYGVRMPPPTRGASWGPSAEGWVLLDGPHLRSLGEIELDWLALRGAVRALALGEPSDSPLLEPAFHETHAGGY